MQQNLQLLLPAASVFSVVVVDAVESVFAPPQPTMDNTIAAAIIVANAFLFIFYLPFGCFAKFLSSQLINLLLTQDGFIKNRIFFG